MHPTRARTIWTFYGATPRWLRIADYQSLVDANSTAIANIGSGGGSGGGGMTPAQVAQLNAVTSGVNTLNAQMNDAVKVAQVANATHACVQRIEIRKITDNSLITTAEVHKTPNFRYVDLSTTVQINGVANIVVTTSDNSPYTVEWITGNTSARSVDQSSGTAAIHDYTTAYSGRIRIVIDVCSSLESIVFSGALDDMNVSLSPVELIAHA